MKISCISAYKRSTAVLVNDTEMVNGGSLLFPIDQQDYLSYMYIDLKLMLLLQSHSC